MSMKLFFPDLPKAGPRRARRLSEEEQALWQAESALARPLVVAHVPKPKPVHAIKIQHDTELSHSFHNAAPLAALEKRMKQKLLRGRIEVDAKLDLHGYFQEEAHDRLISFLIEAQRRQNRIVIVVTGKGNVAPGSGAQFGEGRTGVLRRLVPQWLRAAELRGLVIGFEEAGPAHGGSGALYVRIRRVERRA